MMKDFLKFLVVIVLVSVNAFCVFRTANETDISNRNMEGYSELGKFAFKEAWYGIYFQEDKVGFSHFRIESSGKDFIINSESVMRLTALKKTNEIKMNEKVIVKPDLTLISFESSVKMNDKTLEVTGKNSDGKLLINLATSGEKMDRSYPVEGDLYHSSAISLMPALKGLRQDASYSFTVFNPEKQALELVDQTITRVSGSPGPNDAVWKVQNKFGPSIVNSWLDSKGLTVLEKALDGSLITVIEDESLAKEFLNRKTQQKDLILDFSLVKSPKTIVNPGRTKQLTAVMKGIDPKLFPEDHRQKIVIPVDHPDTGNFQLHVRLENIDAKRSSQKEAQRIRSLENKVSTLDRELAPTFTIQSDHTQIVHQANSIVLPRDNDLERVIKLAKWTSDNIKKTMRDSFSALEVLQTMEGECQAHASLYTAMARALKIPTRIVTGLVYSDGLGFIYHAWAESYIDGWLSVDPTLKQTPADATHIKIGHSPNGDQSDSVLKMVGKLKIESIDYD